MRDYQVELEKRIAFIRDAIKEANANGLIYGNSGGKDSALVGVLCKIACANTLGIIMPCESKQNYGQDTIDALEIAKQFDIETKVVDLSQTKKLLVENINKSIKIEGKSLNNIAPRLRMTTLYTIAACDNRLVVGTGNKSEIFMGYFTKWGDGAFDINPIGDLTVSEIYEFLEYLNAPKSIIEKAPSAGLFEGQTDEIEMGVSYKAIEDYINGKTVSLKEKEIIERNHKNTEHKRTSSKIYSSDKE